MKIHFNAPRGVGPRQEGFDAYSTTEQLGGSDTEPFVYIVLRD